MLVGLIILAWNAYGRKLKSPDADFGHNTEATSEAGSGRETAPSATGHGESSTAAAASDLMSVGIPAELNARLISYPGFTVSFNSQTHQPNFVAWELTGEEAKSQTVSRKSSTFAPDPNVEGCATLDDYRRSGYDRGHMAPAGDMKWDAEAMQSSFLLTNMSPQNHELNQGSWRVLEEKCREWAVRDSAIVIVCGPIFDSHPSPTIGPTGVAVPDRYFKVVLAPYSDPPRAIGFVMNNGSVPGGVQKAAVPVDEVETLTGYDFFAALPDDVEARVEAECNFPRWSKKK